MRIWTNWRVGWLDCHLSSILLTLYLSSDASMIPHGTCRALETISFFFRVLFSFRTLQQWSKMTSLVLHCLQLDDFGEGTKLRSGGTCGWVGR